MVSALSVIDVSVVMIFHADRTMEYAVTSAFHLPTTLSLESVRAQLDLTFTSVQNAATILNDSYLPTHGHF
jgi:hypothetical protein